MPAQPARFPKFHALRPFGWSGACLFMTHLLAGCAYEETVAPGLPSAAYDLLFEESGVSLNTVQLKVRRGDTGAMGGLFGQIIAGASPSVSVNGERVVYVGASTGQTEYDTQDLWTVVRGGAPQRIALSAGTEFSPSLSPNGQRIAYVKLNAQGETQLFVALADGRGETPIVIATAPAQSLRYSSPAWSPDGTRLLFSAGAPGQLHLWTVNMNTGVAVQLTNTSVSDIDGAWSPDGSTVAFVRTQSPARSEIMLRHLTTGAERTFPFAWRNRFPAWSPDGTRLAFASNMTDNGDLELYSMLPDGSGLTRLTDDDARQQSPRWIRR